MYFVQGILGLARLAISFFYKDEFHLDPATVGMHDALQYTMPVHLQRLKYGLEKCLHARQPSDFSRTHKAQHICLLLN